MWYLSSQNRALLTAGTTAHLVPAVVEDAAPPVGVEALLRVGVLVQVRAVEIGQAVFVVGKVRRHPVEDDADAVLVQVVDQVHEVLRRADSGSSARRSRSSDSPRSRRTDAP